MDKSARATLSANVKKLWAGTSRRSWAAEKRIDVKTVERAEKDAGGKGVTMQALDDLASASGLEPWQLLVPGLDPKQPPGQQHS